MRVETQVTIDASRAAVWAAIADIANAAKIVSGILEIEVLQTPENGLEGLRWRETRMLFGKPTSVEKWIIEAAGHQHYTTRAESDGFVFMATLRLSDSGGGVALTSTHDSQPQTFVARLQSIPMGLCFKGVAKKALMQDLVDIKAAVERT